MKKKERKIQDGMYAVRKIKRTKYGNKVYLYGVLFQSFIVKDESIKEYSIVVLKDGKVFKKHGL